MEPAEAARLRGAIRHAELCEQHAMRDQSSVFDHLDAAAARRRVTEAEERARLDGLFTAEQLVEIEGGQ